MKKLLIIAVTLFATLTTTAQAADHYRIAWSHYTGWEPWGYIQDSGIMKKWADKYGIEIETTLVNDYIESINLYTTGQFDGVTVTNMDALTIPAVGGVDSSAIIVGDFSNGNDGIVAKNAATIADLKGRTVRLVELSVSHYMLARALDLNGMTERDLKITNTSDAEIAAVFITDDNGAVVTWNPPLQQVRNASGAKMLFDSSNIPGEIIDMMVVRSDAPDSLKKALTGAWYEAMAILAGHNSKSSQAVKLMANQSGATPAEFKAQLRTTAMFYEPAAAVQFVTGPDLSKTMEYVRTFSFNNGLYGDGAPSKDLVGIELGDGSVLGDKGNIKLRFTPKFMQLAADGKL